MNHNCAQNDINSVPDGPEELGVGSDPDGPEELGVGSDPDGPEELRCGIEIRTLLLGGGGVKTVSYIGVLKKLCELHAQQTINLNISEIFAVSGGCIIAFLYIIGYTTDEMKEIVLNKNFKECKDVKLGNFINHYGIDSGKNIIKWIKELTIKKSLDPEITFSELFEKTRITFNTITTNLTTCSLSVFNHMHSPNLSVIHAIRMAISIPFLFTVERYDNEIYIDAALLHNCPIDLIATQKIPTTIAINCKTHNDYVTKIVSLEQYIYKVFRCLFKRKNIVNPGHIQYIEIKTDINTINFSLSKKEKLKLIQIGYDTTSCILNL